MGKKEMKASPRFHLSTPPTRIHKPRISQLERPLVTIQVVRPALCLKAWALQSFRPGPNLALLLPGYAFSGESLPFSGLQLSS